MKHADKSKRTRNLCNAAMLCCAAAVLLTGLGRTLLRPKDVNYYENRPANTVAPLTAESWLDGSFQDAMEAALSDQIPLAQAMKKTFNDAQNKIRYDSMMRLSHRYPNVPVQYDQLLVYGGKYLAYAYCSPDMVIPELTRHSENLNALIAAHPDVTFYLYMVEGDSNNNFPAGENNGAFEYLSSRVNLPAEQMGRFAVDELETYERDFYQTDHHWCNVGSYRGYREAAALLGCTDLLEPLETVRVSDHFSGSKALSIGAQEQFFEPMYVYRFAFPKMSVTIAGEPADDYGWQDAVFHVGRLHGGGLSDGIQQSDISVFLPAAGGAVRAHPLEARAERHAAHRVANLLRLGRAEDGRAHGARDARGLRQRLCHRAF